MNQIIIYIREKEGVSKYLFAFLLLIGMFILGSVFIVAFELIYLSFFTLPQLQEVGMVEWIKISIIEKAFVLQIMLGALFLYCLIYTAAIFSKKSKKLS